MNPRRFWPVFARTAGGLGWAILTNRRRSFRADAARLVGEGGFRIMVSGAENIPCRGPGVITVNHYWSPTFWAPWLAVILSALVPKDVYWTMTDAFTYPGKLFGGLRRGLSHILLIRVAKAYGFNTMPPMPPAPAEAALRTQSVRRLLDYARKHPACLIGLAPEGYDRPGGALDLPPEGVGRLCLALARNGYRFHPVGIYEEGGIVVVNFGASYQIAEQDQDMDRKEVDLAVRLQVTREISRCLPERLQDLRFASQQD